MGKSLNLDIKVKLPTGQTIDLFNHTMAVSGLEQYAMEAILSATGGKLDLAADVVATEVDAAA